MYVYAQDKTARSNFLLIFSFHCYSILNTKRQNRGSMGLSKSLRFRSGRLQMRKIQHVRIYHLDFQNCHLERDTVSRIHSVRKQYTRFTAEKKRLSPDAVFVMKVFNGIQFIIMKFINYQLTEDNKI